MKLLWAFLMAYMIISTLEAQYDHKDILPQLESQELLEQLIINYKPGNVQSYTDARHFMFREVYNTRDSVETIYAGFKRYLDPQTGDPIQYFLTGDQNIQIDTEHSYPRSKGADRNTDAGSDLHHLFPSRKLINSSRGNLPFGEVPDDETETWYEEDRMQSSIPTADIDDYSELGPDRFEPREIQKGNIARAMFYFYSMYRDQADAADPRFFEVMKDDICSWHFDDPVDSLEWERSMMIGSFQGHEANPFVLDCSLASRLYCDQISDACALLTSTDNIEDYSYHIYPNPSSEMILLEGDISEASEVTLHDISGKKIGSFLNYNQKLEIDISKLNSGIYFFVFRRDGSIIGRAKFVKQ